MGTRYIVLSASGAIDRAVTSRAGREGKTIDSVLVEAFAGGWMSA